MKALFVHDHRFPYFHGGYYESYGFDNSFFNRYLSIFRNLGILARREEAASVNNKGIINENVEFFTLDSTKKLISKKVRSKIKSTVDSYDYIIIRLPSTLGLYVAQYCKKSKKPYLLEIVGCPWDAFISRGIKGLIPAFIITYLTKYTVLNAKYVLYVSDLFLQKRYPTKGKSTGCSDVKLNEVNSEVLKRRIKKLERLDITKDKITIGTCASLDAIYKGQEDVIKAISILSKEGFDIRYEMVGGGSQDYLKNIADKYNVSSKVNFLGALNHNEVFNWLEEIDIYVHPSKQEGLCRAIVEAMSMACPILGSDAGGIHEQIDEDFIFDKSDINGICRMYKNLTTDIMIEQAKKNHNNAKRYLKGTLDEKRNRFFEDFTNGDKLNC